MCVNIIPIVGSFLLVAFLLTKQLEIKDVSLSEKSDNFSFSWSRIIAIAISISVAVVNVINEFWIRLLANWESWPTKTKYEKVLASRITIANVINETVVVVLATYAAHINTFLGQAKVSGLVRENLWKANGLGSNIMTLMLINSFIHIVVACFNLP